MQHKQALGPRIKACIETGMRMGGGRDDAEGHPWPVCSRVEETFKSILPVSIAGVGVRVIHGHS